MNRNQTKAVVCWPRRDFKSQTKPRPDGTRGVGSWILAGIIAALCSQSKPFIDPTHSSLRHHSSSHTTAEMDLRSFLLLGSVGRLRAKGART